MRTLKAVGSALALVVVAGLIVQAQRGEGEGRGAAQGGGRGRGRGAAEPRPPVKQHTFDLQTMEVRYPLAPEDAAYAKINGDHVKQFVNDITAISRKDRDSGNKFWGRLPGTASDKETHDYIAAKFREWGLEDVHIQPVPLNPQWMASDWEVVATGSGTTMPLKTAFPIQGAASTPESGVDLDLVWGGGANELDFAGRDVKGKMTFLQSWPWPNGFQHSVRFNNGLERAVSKGAAGILLNVAITGNLTQSVNGPAQVPGFAIGTEEAAALKALLEKGPVKVHAKLIAKPQPGLVDGNVWGTLPGASPEEVMVVAAHDGRFEAAFTNASGVATMMGLAEYYSKIPKAQRKRTLKFVSHTNPGAQLIHDNKATLLANTVLIINCQHTSITVMGQFAPPDGAKFPDYGRLQKTAAVPPRQWWVYGSDKLATTAFDTFRKMGVALWQDAMWEGGNLGAMSRDVPTVQTIVTPQYFTSDGDKPDIVPASGLEIVGRAYAKLIDRVNTIKREELVQAP